MNETRKLEILEKIRKLQKHQEGAEKIGSFEEAATAAAKMASMMLKYNIELHELLGEQEDYTVLKEYFEFAPYWKRNESHWLFTLMGIVSKPTQTKIMGFNVSGGAKQPYRCIIYGERQNIDSVLYLFDSLVRQVRYLEKIALKEAGSSVTNRNTFIRSYHQGLLAGLWVRFDQLEKDMVQEHGTAALVYIGNAVTRVSDEIQKDFPVTKTITSKSSKSHLGRYAGMQDSKKVTINKGNIGNGNQVKRIS